MTSEEFLKSRMSSDINLEISDYSPQKKMAQSKNNKRSSESHVGIANTYNKLDEEDVRSKYFQLKKSFDGSRQNMKNSLRRNGRSANFWKSKKSPIEEMLKSLLPKLVEEIANRKDNISYFDDEEDVYKREADSTSDSDSDEVTTTTDLFDSTTSDALGVKNPEVNPNCDVSEKDVCWFLRQVGDSITISIDTNNVILEKGSFEIKWIRTYGTRENQPPIETEIEPDRTPWNIVIGGGGTELRLSPITDTDVDRNAFMAKVFSASKNIDKRSAKLLKKLTFRINILPTDLGLLYAGEEININIENFITIPEKGITFNWGLENSLNSISSLPSNMKISRSGRSVTITELKRDRKQILVCVMYSSGGLAVAKRRFKIYSRKSNLEKRSGTRSQPDRPEYNMGLLAKRGEMPNEESSNEFQPYFFYSARKRRTKRSITELVSDVNRIPRKIPSIFYILKKRETQEVMNIPIYSSGHNPWQHQFATSHEIKKKNSDVTPHPVDFFIQPGDETLDDAMPKEIRYVNPVVITERNNTQERSLNRSLWGSIERTHSSNCMTNRDCGPKAWCAIQTTKQPTDKKVASGVCICNPDYRSNGMHCQKLSYRFRRVKRIRRQVPASSYDNNDMSLNHNLFYMDGQIAQPIIPPRFKNIPKIDYVNPNNQPSFFDVQKIPQRANENQNILLPVHNQQNVFQRAINDNQNNPQSDLNIQNNPQLVSANQNVVQTSDNQNVLQQVPNNANIPQPVPNNPNNPQQVPNNPNIPQPVPINQNDPQQDPNNQIVPQQDSNNQNVPQQDSNNQNVPQQVSGNQNYLQQTPNNQNIHQLVNGDYNALQQASVNQNIPDQMNFINGNQLTNSQQQITQNGQNSMIPMQAMQNADSSVVFQQFSGDDMDSIALGRCESKEYCSFHADCLKSQGNTVQAISYCKCYPGFRGNGIFCWEIADYAQNQRIFLEQRQRRFRIHWKDSK